MLHLQLHVCISLSTWSAYYNNYSLTLTIPPTWIYAHFNNHWA